MFLSPTGPLADHAFRLPVPTPRTTPDTVALTTAEIRRIVLELMG
ncbi:hypothetical protein [Humitalea rosea]|nr:hypothetical protein [Humitalea rosea]